MSQVICTIARVEVLTVTATETNSLVPKYLTNFAGERQKTFDGEQIITF